PISIGVSGSWGTGKSSMIRLIRGALASRKAVEGLEFVFVEFNAWRYQGYDDAKAALMEVIAETLVEQAEERKTALDKTRELLRRVKWLRLAKLTIPTAASLALGLPPVGLLGEGLSLLKGLGDG